MRRYKKRKFKRKLWAVSSILFLCLSLLASYEVLKKDEALAVENLEEQAVSSREEPLSHTEDSEEDIEISASQEESVPITFPEDDNKVLPEIPLSYREPVIEADLSYHEHPAFMSSHGIRLKNATQYTNEEISGLLDTPMKMRFKETEKPQFLIYHTHATESFNSSDREFYDSRNNWRSRDNTLNMVSVGSCALEELKKAGISFIHDTSQHDYPSYNGSYKNSFNSVSKILSENEEIKVALDLHRDAIQKVTGEITKPTLTLPDGTKLAQIMIIANCDDGSGLIPNWRENFRFAKEVYLALEKTCPGITRPILLSHRKYNQQLSTGALLIEVGGHANTLAEAQRSGKVLGLALKEIYENFKE